jgi:hypothetical protein
LAAGADDANQQVAEIRKITRYIAEYRETIALFVFTADKGQRELRQHLSPQR